MDSSRGFEIVAEGQEPNNAHGGTERKALSDTSDIVSTLEGLVPEGVDNGAPPLTPDAIAMLHESFLYDDSWGDNTRFEETVELPTRRELLVTPSVSSQQDTTARLKDHGRDNHRGLLSNGKVERHSSARDLKSTNHKGVSQSMQKHLSDDGLEYYMSLAPPTEVARSRSHTGAQTTVVPRALIKRRKSTPEEDALPPPTFMVSKTGTPISEWDLSNYFTSTGDADDDETISAPGDNMTSSLRRRPRVSMHRENLIDSLAWFSFHTPKCVLEDLTSNELEKFEEVLNGASTSVLSGRQSPSPRCERLTSRTPVHTNSDDGSVSSLSDDEESKSASGSGSRSTRRRRARSKGKITADIALSKRLPHTTLEMPYSTKQNCALVFVDISGFTKLSTILDEESLSKVRFCLHANSLADTLDFY
jgi:hypothetical protein